MTAYNVAESVVAVVEAETPAHARNMLRAALDRHGFDPMPIDSLEPMLGAFVSEPDSPAHDLPGACQAPSPEWAHVIEDFTRWKLTPWQAQVLVRLAASAVDTGTLTARSEGFSDPEMIDSLARRTWKAIAYLGDGEPCES